MKIEQRELRRDENSPSDPRLDVLQGDLELIVQERQVTQDRAAIARSVHYHSRMHPIEKSIQQVGEQLVRMRTLAAAPQQQFLLATSPVSAWCSAQHLDHLAKASSSIFRRLLDREAAAPRHGINLIGRLVLALGWIPRGRGKTPERLSGTRADSSTLLASIDEMDALVRQLDLQALAQVRTPVVPHPKFGGLTPAQALRFVAIHNDHHLRIITDISLAAAPAIEREEASI